MSYDPNSPYYDPLGLRVMKIEILPCPKFVMRPRERPIPHRGPPLRGPLRRDPYLYQAKRRDEERERQRAQEEARQRAQEEARQRAQEEARQQAQEEARQRAQEEARQRSQEEARQRAQARPSVADEPESKGVRELNERIASNARADASPELTEQDIYRYLHMSPVGNDPDSINLLVRQFRDVLKSSFKTEEVFDIRNITKSAKLIGYLSVDKIANNTDPQILKDATRIRQFIIDKIKSNKVSFGDTFANLGKKYKSKKVKRTNGKSHKKQSNRKKGRKSNRK